MQTSLVIAAGCITAVLAANLADSQPASSRLPRNISVSAQDTTSPMARMVNMKNALRALTTAEEKYFEASRRYATKIPDLRFIVPSNMVLIGPTVAWDGKGWHAAVRSKSLPDVECAVAVNEPNPILASAESGEPACAPVASGKS